jgi:hypothetical protein
VQGVPKALAASAWGVETEEPSTKVSRGVWIGLRKKQPFFSASTVSSLLLKLHIVT